MGNDKFAQATVLYLLGGSRLAENEWCKIFVSAYTAVLHFCHGTDLLVLLTTGKESPALSGKHQIH